MSEPLTGSQLKTIAEGASAETEVLIAEIYRLHIAEGEAYRKGEKAIAALIVENRKLRAELSKERAKGITG